MLSKLCSERLSILLRDLHAGHLLVDDLVPVGLDLGLLDILELVAARNHRLFSSSAKRTTYVYSRGHIVRLLFRLFSMLGVDSVVDEACGIGRRRL